jgi:signal recognition particle subunit SRP54
MSGEGFTLQDFVEQIAMVRKLGPIGNLLGMLPGAGRNKELLDQVNDKDLDRAAAIVQSMTPEERRNPKIINGTRRARIANGSGVTPGQVSALITNFLEGQKQMRQMLGGGIPGMPAIPGMRRAATKAAKGKKAKKKPKGGRPGGDPRRAAASAAGNASGAEPAGTAPGADGRGGLPGGLSDAAFSRELAEGLASLQQGGGLPPGGLPGLGTPDSKVPAAFRGQGANKRRKKK